jgi:hypothetical protein
LAIDSQENEKQKATEEEEEEEKETPALLLLLQPLLLCPLPLWLPACFALLCFALLVCFPSPVAAAIPAPLLANEREIELSRISSSRILQMREREREREREIEFTPDFQLHLGLFAAQVLPHYSQP